MDNLNDNNLDELFREGSNLHDFPFKESSWEKMESLIEEDKKEKGAFLRYGLLGLLALFSVAGVLFTLNTNENNAKSPKQEQAQEVEVKSIASSSIIENHSPSENNIQSKNNTQAFAETQKNETNTQLKSDTPTSTVVKEHLRNQMEDPAVRVSSKVEPTRPLANNIVNKPQQAQSPIVAYESIQNKQVIESKEQLNAFKIESVTGLNAIKTSPLRSEKRPFLDRSKVPDLSPKKNNRFGVSLIAGKEYSSVGAFNNMSGGYRIGLELNYQFNNKFEIRTAAIVSRKEYSTEAQNYSFSQATMQAIMPETVHGFCDVTEIPVEFSYFFNSYDRPGFYFTAGASTFLMRKEWYDFEYSSVHDGNQNLPRFWSDEGINNHIFGVGTLSFGYQQPVNKFFTVRLEPYFQIPLTGIGSGQVNLVSAGIQAKLLLKK